MPEYGGISPNACRLGGALLDREGLPGLSVSIALAGWLCLPTLWASQGLATAARDCPMRGMFLADLHHSWNDLSPHAQAFECVVSRHLVGHKSKDGRERPWIAADSGVWKLRNGMVLATQTQARHDQARPRATVGQGGGR
jgi:hypothetical protein